MDTKDETYLYVKNLEPTIGDVELGNLFAGFPDMISARVMRDEEKNRGFGFVGFSRSDTANRAILEMNGRMIGAKPMIVRIAQTKTERVHSLAVQYAEAQMNPRPQPRPSDSYCVPIVPVTPYQTIAGCIMQPFVAINPTVVPMVPTANVGVPRPILGQRYPDMIGNPQGFLVNSCPVEYGYIAHVNPPQPTFFDGTPPPPSHPPVKQAVFIEGHEPLTPSMLAAATPSEQKQMLGERLYVLIRRLYPELAGKLTGMLLELDNGELFYMLEDSVALESMVADAMAVLAAHGTKLGRKL